MGGRLYICSTPIGNLEDITLRTIRVLRKVDLVVAEDTRRSRVLLQRYQIKTPFARSYYQGVEEERSEAVLKLLEAGRDVALISNAGTPLISDPGYPLVREAIERDFEVIALPGPTALVPALIASGFPVHAFIFDGAPPKKEKKRREYFSSLREERRTVVLYESPHRVLKTLETMVQVLPEREVALCRELTKLHEEVLRGKPAELLETLKQREKIKGELVLVIRGATT